MSDNPSFDKFIEKYLGPTTEITNNVFDVGLIHVKDLCEILYYYVNETRNGNNSTWFDCTGPDGTYYTYIFKCNYKKPDEVVYKFKCEFNLP